MSDSGWIKGTAVGLGILVLAAALAWPSIDNHIPKLKSIPEGTLAAPGCGYDEAVRAEAEAERQAQATEKSQSRGLGASKSDDARKAAEARKNTAKECEERARGWSDLSAQWQSARAASVTADLTRMQLIGTGLEVLILIAALIAATWAALETREANKIARDEYKAARDEANAEQGSLAEQLAIAKRSERAWMAVQIFRPIPMNAYFADDAKKDLRYQTVAIRCVWENTGKSPALCTSLYTAVRVLPINQEIPAFVDPHGGQFLTSCAPGRVKYSGDHQITPAEYESVRAHTHKLIVYSRIEYEVSNEPGVTKHSEATVEMLVNAIGREQDEHGVMKDRFADRVRGTQQSYT